MRSAPSCRRSSLPTTATPTTLNLLSSHGRGLLRRDVVITGSLVTSKPVRPGDLIAFSLEGLGSAELRVD